MADDTRRNARWSAVPLLSRPDRLALAGLLVVVLAVAGTGLVGNYAVYRLDVVTFYLPWYSHLGERLRDLDIPGWLPYTMSGVPFAGDPQSGWGYLPTMVIFTIAPGLWGFKAFVLFHILLAAFSTYAFARIVGLGAMGALAAAIGFALGNFLERTVCCTIHMQLAVWIPVAYLGIELAMRADRWTSRVRWLVLVGFACSQVLAGWVGQGAYYGMLAVGAYLAFRIVLARDRSAPWLRRPVELIASGALVLALALALAAPALLPRLDTVDRSNLADLYGAENDEDGSQSSQAWSLGTLGDRLLRPGERGGRWYLGAALVTAALAALALVGRRGRAWYFAIFGAVVLSLMLRDFPTSDALGLLPRFSDLHRHLPERILIIGLLAPAMLAGALIDLMVDPERRRTPGWRVALAIIVPLVVFAGLAGWLEREELPRLPEEALVPAAVVLLTLLIGLLARSGAIRVLSAGVIILALVVDPAVREFSLYARNPTRQERQGNTVAGYTEPTPAALWLQERAAEGELFRYFGYDPARLMLRGSRRTYHISYNRAPTMALLVNNRGVGLELADIQGYNPVQIDRYADYFDWINGLDQSYHAANVLFTGLDSPLINMLNVRYIVIPREPVSFGRPDLFHLSQRYPTVYVDSRVRILENPYALPRAWIVHEAEAEDSAETILARFSLRLVDPRETALMEGEAPELEEPADPAVESVTVTDYEADTIRLHVTATARGMVVLSEIWDPAWSATVDGDEVDAHRVNSILRGIVVEPGEHEIVLRFDPEVVGQSTLIGLGGVAAIVGILAATWLWDRRAESRREGAELTIRSGQPLWRAPLRARNSRLAGATRAPPGC